MVPSVGVLPRQDDQRIATDLCPATDVPHSILLGDRTQWTRRFLRHHWDSFHRLHRWTGKIRPFVNLLCGQAGRAIGPSSNEVRCEEGYITWYTVLSFCDIFANRISHFAVQIYQNKIFSFCSLFPCLTMFCFVISEHWSVPGYSV